MMAFRGVLAVLGCVTIAVQIIRRHKPDAALWMAATCAIGGFLMGSGSN